MARGCKEQPGRAASGESKRAWRWSVRMRAAFRLRSGSAATLADCTDCSSGQRHTALWPRWTVLSVPYSAWQTSEDGARRPYALQGWGERSPG
eukprot:6892376-Prymnesium_polylepis.1